MYLATLSIVLLLAVSQSIAENPGVKMRVTQKGFDYANRIARGVIAKQLDEFTIEDQSGTMDGNTYWLQKFIPITFSGYADVDASGVSLTVTSGFGVDDDGRPTMFSRRCRDNIGSVQVSFRGALSWIFNAWSGAAGRWIRNGLSGRMCEVVKKSIREDIRNALKKMNVTVELYEQFILDYGLSSAPVVTANYLETQHKGKIYWKDNRTEVPFSPAPIPSSSAPNNMLYMWGSDFVVKAIALVAQNNNFLAFNITKTSLSNSTIDYLNTTCSPEILCVSSLIPQLGEAHPNSEVEIHITSLATPDVKFQQDNISLALYGATTLVVRKPDNSTSDLFTLYTNLTLSANAWIEDEMLMAEITDYDFRTDMTTPTVGQYDREGLNQFLVTQLNETVIPGFNSIGRRGVVLPITEDIGLQHFTLQVLDGAIMVATDFTYTHSP